MKTICFVCLGNICRSPMAEVIFSALLKKNKIKRFKVMSFGIGAHEGQNMQIFAKRAVKKLGYNAGNKKSKLLRIIDPNFLYLTMTKEQKNYLNKPNVLTLGEVIGGEDVSDPFGNTQEVYDNMARKLENYCKLLLDKFSLVLNEENT